MNIPSVPTSAIDYPEPGKPCAPFTLVFLLKLQAWEDHRDSTELRFRAKASTDALDLRTMLPIARARGLTIQRKEVYLSPLFVASAKSRVRRFVQEWPDTLHGWRALGFRVDTANDLGGPGNIQGQMSRGGQLRNLTDIFSLYD